MTRIILAVGTIDQMQNFLETCSFSAICIKFL